MYRLVNFRDLGESLALLMNDPPIDVGLVFRGGKFDALSRVEELGGAKTILNLRRGADPRISASITYLHVPTDDAIENYDTRDRRVRRWLSAALGVLAEPQREWPVYVHCTSGKDRTGVFVAAILRALGVAEEIIVEEYLLSDGVARANIEGALAGLRDFELPEAVRDTLAQRLRQGQRKVSTSRM
jgi:protein-tyrosine phosphatase